MMTWTCTLALPADRTTPGLTVTAAPPPLGELPLATLGSLRAEFGQAVAPRAAALPEIARYRTVRDQLQAAYQRAEQLAETAGEREHDATVRRDAAKAKLLEGKSIPDDLPDRLLKIEGDRIAACLPHHEAAEAAQRAADALRGVVEDLRRQAEEAVTRLADEVHGAMIADLTAKQTAARAKIEAAVANAAADYFLSVRNAELLASWDTLTIRHLAGDRIDSID